MSSTLSLPSSCSPEAIAAERARRRYLRDPVAWINERCAEFVWSKQREICESVRDNRRTAVKSCHGSGKSFTAARIACWWIDTHPPGEAFVVTTASTASQVRAVLWREMHRVHSKAHLAGRMNQIDWWMQMPAGHEELVAFGRKPQDMDATAFQGIHARWVLVLMDEACGVATPIWEGAEGLISNDESRIVVFGNPTDPQTEFYEVCKPGSGWNVIRISAFDTPNFTDEDVPDSLRRLLVGRTWVEEKRRRWSETNPLWIAKITGEFPEINTDGLIPIAWIRMAQERYAERQLAGALEPEGPNELGVDVGAGGDPGAIGHRQGPVFRIRQMLHTPDTMETLGHVLQQLEATGATVAKIDVVGIGKGVVDRGLEQDKPIIGINVGESALDTEHYDRLRSELFWGVRERFQDGHIDIDAEDDDLAAELVAIKWKPNSRGQTVVESKDDMKRRGLASPNRADALMLAFAPTGTMGSDAIGIGGPVDDGPVF